MSMELFWTIVPGLLVMATAGALLAADTVMANDDAPRTVLMPSDVAQQWPTHKDGNAHGDSQQ